MGRQGMAGVRGAALTIETPPLVRSSVQVFILRLFSVAMTLPRHLTVWNRNQRLNETLKGVGLFTEVVLFREDPKKIDRIIVAAGKPTIKLRTAKCLPRRALFLRWGALRLSKTSLPPWMMGTT